MSVSVTTTTTTRSIIIAITISTVTAITAVIAIVILRMAVQLTQRRAISQIVCCTSSLSLLRFTF